MSGANPIDPAPTRRVLIAATVVTLAAAAWIVLEPMLGHPTRWGWNDWDSHASYRFITSLAIRKYHTLPWWNPYMCGGFPAWAYSEGATNVLSPYLPFYVALPIDVALRVEVVGSTLTGILGTALLASRHVRSIALRMLVVGLYAINGRWALQLSEGHSWHFQYAWLPFVLYALDRAVQERRLRWAVAAGGFIALIATMGGIYPLPHTVLLVLGLAALQALRDRSAWPIATVAVSGYTAFVLSAPKLLPMMELMRRYPRLVSSREAIGLHELLVMMTSRDQNFYSRPVPVPEWEWHEWGIYVGWGGVLVLGCGVLLSRSRALGPYRVLGILLVLLGLGRFHDFAPWALLHQLPIFSSQHVPSRFVYPATLLLALCGAAWLDRTLGTRERTAAADRMDLLLLVPCALLCLDIASVGRGAMNIAFPYTAAKPTPAATFTQQSSPPLHYTPRERHDSVLLPMMANTGATKCYGLPTGAQAGVVPFGDPRYRGEAFVAGGTGTAEVVGFTPNEVVTRVTGVGPGSVVAINMNWDPGWRANGEATEPLDGVTSARADHDGIVRFAYRPPWLGAGLLVCAFGVASLVAAALAKPRLRAWRARAATR